MSDENITIDPMLNIARKYVFDGRVSDGERRFYGSGEPCQELSCPEQSAHRTVIHADGDPSPLFRKVGDRFVCVACGCAAIVSEVIIASL